MIETVPADKRFWAKVDKRGDDECWEWTGSRNEFGRALFYYQGRSRSAARFALEMAAGKPLGELFACHSCDNPGCVNPAHLWAGTQKDNMKDSAAKGRHWQQRKTHCPRGHALAEGNVYLNRWGRRTCLSCKVAIRRGARFPRAEARQST